MAVTSVMLCRNLTVSPGTVFQIVVLRSTEFLDAAVAAVVVRHEKSLVGNHLARAASAELYDGILQ